MVETSIMKEITCYLSYLTEQIVLELIRSATILERPSQQVNNYPNKEHTKNGGYQRGNSIECHLAPE